MKTILNYKKSKHIKSRSRHESGAALIMVYLAILMFLYVAILFLDIPFMERVGRTIQRAADAASLAGTVQLTKRSYQNADLPTRQAYRAQGWRDAKRAVFAALKANEIAGIETSIFPSTPTFIDDDDDVEGDDDHSHHAQDTLDNSAYGYESFTLSNGVQTGILTITRGVYERPASWTPPTPQPQIFYPIEIGHSSRTGNQCIAAIVGPPALPSACDFPQPIENVADSVLVTITVDNVPTLFAKLLGFNSFATITRTATSGPM